jgi:pimeloyl-ACP methyl ester carboxylesterase
MRRIVGAIVVLAVCLLAVLGAQAVWHHVRLADAGTDGRMVDVGGRSLHLRCTGAGGPTYVLEAGAVGFAEMWQWVQAGLAASARVCAYDRAGLGASDPAPGSFAPARVSRDLKAALDVAGEMGPFILVGHSLGGVFVRGFAAAYPDAVAALVLVDPAHEDQLDHFDEETARYFEIFRRMATVMPVAARFGLLHVWNPFAAASDGLDGAARGRAALYLQSPAHLASASAELAAWDAIMEDTRRSPVPPSIPTLVVSAGAVPGRGAEMKARILALHRGIAGHATVGRHGTIEAASHFSILTDRDIAAQLVRMIRDFTARARRG